MFVLFSSNRQFFLFSILVYFLEAIAVFLSDLQQQQQEIKMITLTFCSGIKYIDHTVISLYFHCQYSFRV